MNPDEITGLAAACLAALCFGTYGVPMKGETATRLDVDPLVFQSYKAFTVFVVSYVLICVNNLLADYGIHNASRWSLLEDFTPWAFVSAIMWVPGGTAGVYAIRRAGLAISVGIWSSVIVLLSFMWGVLIFGEKQRSAIGAIGSVAVLCVGLTGIAFFSSVEVGMKGKKQSSMVETTPLVAKEDTNVSPLDHYCAENLELFPHCGTHPHSHQIVDLHLPTVATNHEEHTLHISKYHIGLFMAAVNGVLAATIMVPLHYAPANTTRGVGYSMSFGIAAVIVVALMWALRLLVLSLEHCISHPHSGGTSSESRRWVRIVAESFSEGYLQLPSFHVREMWRPGLTSGILYSLGNLFGIVSIQRLGDFMGYSLNQSSIIVSGLWGLFYYREVPGITNIVGFFVSTCVVFVGILLMANEHA